MQVSERQTEILGLLQKGLTNKDIGRQLGLSPNTVRDHISVLLLRNGLTGRAALAAWHVSKTLALRTSVASPAPPAPPATTPLQM